MRWLIVLILLSGCATQQRCFDKWGEVRDTVYYRDTVYFISVDTDTVYNTSYVTDTVNASTGLAGGSAWVLRDTLYLKVWQNDTVIEYRDSVRYVERVVNVDVPCPKVNIWNKLIVLGAILLLIIILSKFK